MGDCRVRSRVRCTLGEGPLWSARDNAVYWVDILAPAVYRYSLDDGTTRGWDMPDTVGWVIERAGQPGFIAGLKSGFARLTLDPFGCDVFADPEPDCPGNRMNDARADRFGRIWAGTMDSDMRTDSGSLYRLDTDGSITTVDSGYRVTNGPAFGLRDDCLYHSDTARRMVYRFDMSADGDVANKSEFIEFADDWGFPDGMTVDAEGGLWIAHWDGGRVSRFLPDGRLERCIGMPASRITSCTFAGPNLDRLFVTSAALDREHEELAGMLFEVDPGVSGLPTRQYGG
jgi:xylono-1,5-lactonase